jgi:hypothetical protein
MLFFLKWLESVWPKKGRVPDYIIVHADKAEAGKEHEKPGEEEENNTDKEENQAKTTGKPLNKG